MLKTDKESYLNVIKKFSEQKVLVIGDLILDKYSWCEVNRLSPEVPVPVALVDNETYALGGAANVADNLRTLGAEVEVIGSIANDFSGEKILSLFKEKKIIFNNLFISQEKKSTLKNRIMCGIHQLIRIDNEDVKEISKTEEKKILKYLSENLGKFNIIILSDYAKGFITKNIAESTIKLAKKKNIKVLVDPSLGVSYKYKNAFLIKPNKKEAEHIISKSIASDYSNLIKVGREIKAKYKSNVVITLGKDGILIIDGHEELRLKTFAREVFDVSGAGDTTMAALALGLSSGASVKEATTIANYCAGLVVAKVGTSSCTISELKKVLSKK